eukprot:g1628.t1
MSYTRHIQPYLNEHLSSESKWITPSTFEDGADHEELTLELIFTFLPYSLKKKATLLDIGAGYGNFVRQLENWISDPNLNIIGSEYQKQIANLGNVMNQWAFQYASRFQGEDESSVFFDQDLELRETDQPNIEEEDEGEIIRTPPPLAKKIKKTNLPKIIHGDARDILDTFITTSSKTTKQRDGGLALVSSHLALLHIGKTKEEKIELMEKISMALNTKGLIYFEDIVALKNWSQSENYDYVEKIRRVISMPVMLSEADYVNELLVNFTHVEEETEEEIRNTEGEEEEEEEIELEDMVVSVTKSWAAFTLKRWKDFEILSEKDSICLDATISQTHVVHEGEVEGMIKNGEDCVTFVDLLGMKGTQHYLQTQKTFFCEVCELFNGRNYPTRKTDVCACGAQFSKEGPSSHPPLVGGVYILGQKKGEVRK